MNLIVLNSMLFDAAPPLGFIVIAALIIVGPVLILLTGLAVWLVRKATARKKRNADTASGDKLGDQTGNEGK